MASRAAGPLAVLDGPVLGMARQIHPAVPRFFKPIRREREKKSDMHAGLPAGKHRGDGVTGHISVHEATECRSRRRPRQS